MLSPTDRFQRHLILIVIVFLIIRRCSSLGIDRDNILYPYGTEAGDTEISPIDDDDYVPIDLGSGTNLKVFDEYVRRITVTDNGMLNFGTDTYNDRDNTLITPTDYLDYPALLFAYWSNWDFRNNGSVYYREVFYGDQLERATNDIRSGLASNSHLSLFFRATYLFVVTYSEGIHWGEDDPDEHNTVQIVIASDMIRTFALINYGYLTWTETGTHARVGYDTANQFGYYDHPYSHTARIGDMDSYSNVHVKGRTLFQIDMICDPDTCGREHGVCLEDSYCLCEDGYTGRTCDSEIVECANYPCEHGDCTDLIDDYHCDCDEGYSGRDCDVDIDFCEGDPCIHGTCEDLVPTYRCNCEPGYTGINCETDINECASCPCAFGDCLDNLAHWSCDCEDGYTGDNCEQNINDCLSNPCEHGMCVDDVSHYLCYCHPGYTGEHCESDINECDADPCERGTCMDAVNDFICECPPGFTGNNCEEDIDECLAQPCLHGTCFDGINSFRCDCEAGYTGHICEADIKDCNTSSCRETGYCQDTIPGFICSCLRGFTGPTCEEDINECESLPCQNNGTCINMENRYECHCNAGFTGDNCEININECESSPCLNGPCRDRVNSFFCPCSVGYTGKVCETNIDDCLSEPCDHGFCKDLVNGFQCLCYPGFTGSLCEEEIDECRSSPCRTGRCVDVTAGYVCDCPDGVMGEQCSDDTRPMVGAWGDWSVWSTCSKLCDSGLQTRYRQCMRAPCLDKNHEARLCNTVRCHGNPAEPERMAVTMETSKSQQEVVEEEGLLKSAIADGLNSYCSQNRGACCRIINITVPTALTSFHTFYGKNVSIASGYPLMVDNKVIRIKVLVMTSVGDLRAACLGRSRRAVSIMTASQVIYVPWGIVNDAITRYLDRINQVTCCWSLTGHGSDNSVSYILMGVLIPLGIIIFILCIVIVASPRFIRRGRASSASETTTSGRASRIKWPYLYPAYTDRRARTRVEGYDRGRRY